MGFAPAAAQIDPRLVGVLLDVGVGLELDVAAILDARGVVPAVEPDVDRGVVKKSSPLVTVSSSSASSVLP
jgi:hypothetical protein